MRGLLRQDRKDILSQIGFVWKVSSRKGELPEPTDDDSRFYHHFRQLIEYKKAHGSYPESHHGDVGKWATDQKQLMAAGKLEEMKSQRFAVIGFCNDGEDEIWMRNYQKLQQNGYHSIVTLEDPMLTHWVICQRYLHKKGLLVDERKTKFFDIPGFVWDSTPINLPQPEPKHATKEKTKKKAKKAPKKEKEDPAATSSESEDDDGVDTASGNYIGLLALASEWRDEADKQKPK